MALNTQCRKIVESDWFNNSVLIVIIVNSILIGFETAYPEISWIAVIQKTILGTFTLEILMRWIGKKSAKNYFADGWNIFDIIIIGVGYIPDTIIANAEMLSAFRLLRIFRVLRIIHAVPELALITSVLIRSIRSLSFTGILFALFMYLYAIIGVVLFKLPGKFDAVAPDPYGNIGEAFFTLFRILTGEDWTDLRYNLLGGVSPHADWIVTLYHVSWMVISAFLLVNLVMGVVINNFNQAIQEQRERSNNNS